MFRNLTIINVQPPAVKSATNDEEDEWEIEKSVDRRRKRNRLEYFVRWKGWSSEYDELKTVEFRNARRLLRDYDHANLDHVEVVNRIQSHVRMF